MNSIVIAPTFLKPSCAVGQIERHFFPQLPDSFFSHIICAEDALNLEGNRFKTYILPESQLVLKADMLFRKIGWTDLVYSPDSTYYSWCKRAKKEATTILKREQIDFVYTINNPVSAHLVGYELKKKYGIPWVAQLYDPWSNNAFRKYKYSYFAKKDGKRERLVAEYADLILFPNSELLDSWVNMYGDLVAKKVFIMPFTTEIPEEPTSCLTKTAPYLTVSHIGTLSEDRRPDVFFQSVSRLYKMHPEDIGRLKVNIVGHITDTDKKLIKQDGLEETITIIGRVSEEECIQYYKAADVFLIIDINCSPNLFYPSKLLKYFCYQKPIVGLTMEESVVANELNKTGNKHFDYNDVEGLSEYLHLAINDYNSICQNDKSYYRRFLVDNTSAILQDCLSNILK
jgi:glycosyltransferase involved in cell wall biosynthesis